jgi:hypothetical protein
MKIKNRYKIISLILLSSIIIQNVESKMHKVYKYNLDDNDDNDFTSIGNSIQKEINRINQYISSIFSNNSYEKNQLEEYTEESPEIKEKELIARKKLENVNAEIKEDKDHVILTISNLKDADLDKIDIEVKKIRNLYNQTKRILKGIIPFNEGSIEFVIDGNNLELTKKTSIKIEKKEKLNQDSKDKDKKGEKVEFRSFESSRSNIQQLPQRVLIDNNIKPKIKDNELTIVLKKETGSQNKNSSKLEIVRS